MQFLAYPKDPDLQELDEILSWPPHQFYDYLDSLGLIHYHVNCHKCDSSCTLITDESRKEGFRLRCSRCRAWRNLKKNSWFENTKEDLKLFLHVAVLWKNNYKQKQLIEQTGSTKKRVEQVVAKIRAAIKTLFENNPVNFALNGKNFEIDEAKLVPWRMRRTTVEI